MCKIALHKEQQTHARRQLLVALAEWLCAHHRRDARAGRIVADMHLHLLPTMNPDGCAFGFHMCHSCAYSCRMSYQLICSLTVIGHLCYPTHGLADT